MNRLKELRKRRGLTLAELKDKIKDKQGVSFSTGQLPSYENSKRSPRNESANDFEKQIRIDTLNNVLNKLYQTHDLLLETASKDFWRGYTAAVLIVQTQKMILEFEESTNGK